MTPQKAEKKIRRSVEKALGYVELAKMSPDNGSMIAAAIRTLKAFSDDDEAIDAMCDADMEEYYNKRIEKGGTDAVP